MIRLPVSVLAIGFVADGIPPRQTLAGTISLARSAEQPGFLRFWVAEHREAVTTHEQIYPGSRDPER